MVISRKVFALCLIILFLCPNNILAKDFINPDILVRLNPQDYELDLDKPRVELEFKIQSPSLYLNQDSTNLQARLYEMKNGEKVFLASSNSRIEPRSKHIYVKLSPGHFDTASKDILLEIYDEKNTLIKDFDATISATNLGAQLETKLTNLSSDPNTKLIENIFANKLIFETNNKDPFTVRVVRNQDDTYKVLLPVSRIVSQKGHKGFIPKSITKHQANADASTSSEFSANHPKALISGSANNVTGSGFDLIALTALTAGQADIARIVQDGNVNNSTINGGTVINTNIIGTSTFNGATVKANKFIGGIFNGDASQLKNIPGTRVVGNVDNARNLVGTGIVSGAHEVRGGLTFFSAGRLNNAILNGTTLLTTGSKITGNVELTSSASRFIGNGSGLTNIPAAAIIGTVSTTVASAAIVTNPSQPNIITLTNLANVGTTNTSNTTFTGAVTANKFIGDGSQLTGIGAATVNNGTTVNVTLRNGQVLAGDIFNSVIDNSTVNNTVINGSRLTENKIDGILTFTKNGSVAAPNSRILANVFNGQVFNGGLFKGRFSGNGSGLTNLTGANVAGVVANARNLTGGGSITGIHTVTGLINFSAAGKLEAPVLNGTTLLRAGSKITGNVELTSSASRFIGNGSGLTNIPAAATVTNASQPSITNLPNLTSIGASISSSTTLPGSLTAAKVTAGIFNGDASQLKNIPGVRITGTIAGTIANAQTATAPSQPNITTLPSVSSIGSTTVPRVNIQTVLHLPVLTARSQFPVSPVLGDIVLYKPATCTFCKVPRACLYIETFPNGSQSWIPLQYYTDILASPYRGETNSILVFTCN